MGEGSMILPRCGQCASGRHSHCEHPDFPAPARSCCCGLLEFEDPVVDLEDRQAMALVAKFWAESDEGGEGSVSE